VRVTEWYRTRRALVIGGLGYIGSNVTAALVDAHAIVTVVTPNRDRHEVVARRFEDAGARIIEADIRETATIRDAVR